jgi:hypothetical protein
MVANGSRNKKGISEELIRVEILNICFIITFV